MVKIIPVRCFLPVTPLCLQLLLASGWGSLLGLLSGLLVWTSGALEKDALFHRGYGTLQLLPGRLASQVCAGSPAVQCRARSSPWLRSCCEGLCALSVLAGITRGLKAMKLKVLNTNHAVWCLMPSWTLSPPLPSRAALPQPRATIVFYTEVRELGEINFSACDILLNCLSPRSLTKPQPIRIVLEYVTEAGWGRALVFALEVAKVFCSPEEIVCVGCCPAGKCEWGNTKQNTKSDSVRALLCNTAWVDL